MGVFTRGGTIMEIAITGILYKILERSSTGVLWTILSRTQTLTIIEMITQLFLRRFNIERGFNG